jgi:hypothetical protein
MDRELRRDFILPEDDREFLDASFPEWEAVSEGKMRWLIISNFKIPDGYLIKEAALAINIPSTYPDTKLDMAYFHPPLAREDGVAIGATGATATISGKAYQRWSRHYDWRLGIDSLRSHILFVEEWLTREFSKRRSA